MATPVTATLFLRAGPELFEEPWDGDTLALARTQALSLGAVDGGLWLADAPQGAATEGVACRPDLWDQLDGVLASWLGATTALLHGAAFADVRFPDTRIEVELARHNDQVTLAYEDLDASLPLKGLHGALVSAAQRLLDAAAQADIETPNLQDLSAALDAAQEPPA